jgi:hypothetical protein
MPLLDDEFGFDDDFVAGGNFQMRTTASMMRKKKTTMTMSLMMRMTMTMKDSQ